MTILLTILHILVCLFLIGVVLLQTGKRADLAGAFGGGGSQTAFGARGAATALSKMTTIGAVMFMFTSIFLTVMLSGSGSESVLEQVDTPAAQVDEGSVDPALGTDPAGTSDDLGTSTSDDPLEGTDTETVDPDSGEPATDDASGDGSSGGS